MLRTFLTLPLEGAFVSLKMAVGDTLAAAQQGLERQGRAVVLPIQVLGPGQARV